MAKRFVIGSVGALCVILAVVVAKTPSAFAHGEAADEPFLKNMTTAFFNVSVSPTEIEVGEPVKVTGSVKILETWPHTLETPEIASIMPVVPGRSLCSGSVLSTERPPSARFSPKRGTFTSLKWSWLAKSLGTGMCIPVSPSMGPVP